MFVAQRVPKFVGPRKLMQTKGSNYILSMSDNRGYLDNLKTRSMKEIPKPMFLC